jgi:hypothetical protein
VAGLLRLLAIGASVLVALGFVLFAIDETSKGSDHQVSELEGSSGTASPAPTRENPREQESGPVREAIDDAGDALISPFTGLVDSDSEWVKRLVPTALGLLLYGFGGLMLANYLPGPRREAHDWREPT